MTDAMTSRVWHRAGPVAAIAALLVGSTMQGCSCGDSDTTASGGSTGTAGAGGTNTTGTGGTGGGVGGTGGAGAGSLHATQIANDPTAFTSPFDAVPDPTGNTIYFTGLDSNSEPSVFKADVKTGKVTTISKGDPLVAPFSITTSSDGKTLYVADAGAVTGTADTDRGVIWKMGVGLDQTPTAVKGTDGKTAKSLVLTVEGSADTLYFTGAVLASGEPAIFKVLAAGGTASPVVSGDPLVDPSGLAITESGDIYVADTVGSGSHAAQILKVHKGSAAVFVDGLTVNYPAGVALNKDDSTLLVSSLDDDASDLIIQIDVGTKKQTDFTKSGSVDLTTLFEAGGMHRGVTNHLFGWVDGAAGSKASGSVYLLKFQ